MVGLLNIVLGQIWIHGVKQIKGADRLLFWEEFFGFLLFCFRLSKLLK